MMLTLCIRSVCSYIHVKISAKIIIIATLPPKLYNKPVVFSSKLVRDVLNESSLFKTVPVRLLTLNSARTCAQRV